MDITVSCGNENLYPFLHAAGFSGVDIKMEKTEQAADGTTGLREKIRAARAAGLCIGQTHLPFCSAHLPPARCRMP